ncbi:MAG: lysine-sensitive aspartokinase 3 [Bryobacteraceae bacterium]|nr:lysine-sensitive aspartokinase 3 [Bryobacteraceae bacterium]
MIVMKFGGTSVESAEAIARCAGIVRARLDRKPVVVVSAMGKTTNGLLAIAHAAVSGARGEAARLLHELKEYHRRESGMDRTVDEHFGELTDLVNGLAVLGELTPRATDAIASFGERLSSLIVARLFQDHGLRTVPVDSRSLIVTDHRFTQAAPDFAATYANLRRVIPDLLDRVPVMGGFIGATRGGITTTLGRGGSDFTAAIVGAGLDAGEIQIWTDVDGMLTADPTLIPDAHRLKRCSFAEAAELAYFGAKVLHPATVIPAIERDVPVRILNSRRPENEGTLIVREPMSCWNAIKSIACKRNITVVNIVSSRMLMAHGFLRGIFEIFDRFETPVDMLATSEVSVSLTIDNTHSLEPILAAIREFAEVSVERDQAIVCLVGEDLRNRPGLAARIFRALESINIRMISQGASLLNVSVVVASGDLKRAVELLHGEFFRELDPAVFE